MTAQIYKLYPSNSAENPDLVLEQAVGQYGEVIIIGYDKNGQLDVRASTNWKTNEIIFALEAFKFKLFNGDYSE